MDYYKEYIEIVNKYEDKYYKNKLIKKYEEQYNIENQYFWSLPMIQYRAYLGKIKDLEHRLKKLNIDKEKFISQYKYEFHHADNYLKEYMKLIYNDKTASYRATRKNFIKSKILRRDYNSFILSFLEYDKFSAMISDLRRDF